VLSQKKPKMREKTLNGVTRGINHLGAREKRIAKSENVRTIKKGNREEDSAADFLLGVQERIGR